MNGVATMLKKEHGLEQDPRATRTLRSDPEAVRLLNEKIAIIDGLTELLADGSFEEDVTKAALESIQRHVAGLKELLKQF